MLTSYQMTPCWRRSPPLPTGVSRSVVRIPERQADQFMVQHAQASYYDVLLEAGVRIYLYPKPTVLHAKHFTVDDMVGIIGSSNMDYCSFGLDYEITLMSIGQQFVSDLQAVADGYRAFAAS